MNSTYSWSWVNTPFSTWPTTDNANLQLYVWPDYVAWSRWNWSNSDYVSANYDCTDWTWHHVVITNGSNWLRIYCDWALKVSSNNVRIMKSDNWWTFIWYWKNWAIYLWYISNVIIETKVRTAQEVLDYYNKTKTKYWR